jgi:putative phosphoribosyl transferase
MKPQEMYVNQIDWQSAPTTILVDDGAASGATMITAARSVRKVTAPNSKLIIALPVSPRETVNNLLRKEADYIEVVTKPSFFTSVGQYYQIFEAVNDEKVIETMKKNRHAHV